MENNVQQANSMSAIKQEVLCVCKSYWLQGKSVHYDPNLEVSKQPI